MDLPFVKSINIHSDEENKINEVTIKTNLKVSKDEIHTEAIINIKPNIEHDGKTIQNPVYASESACEFMIEFKVGDEKKKAVIRLEKLNFTKLTTFISKSRYVDLISYLNKQDNELTLNYLGYSICHRNTNEYNQCIEFISNWPHDCDNFANILRSDDIKDSMGNDIKLTPINIIIYEYIEGPSVLWSDAIPTYQSINGDIDFFMKGEHKRHPLAKDYLINTSQKIHQLHNIGIVHCDLVPHNILCLSDGNVRINGLENSKLNSKASLNDEEHCLKDNKDVVLWVQEIDKYLNNKVKSSSKGKMTNRKKKKRKKRKKKKTKQKDKLFKY